MQPGQQYSPVPAVTGVQYPSYPAYTPEPPPPLRHPKVHRNFGIIILTVGSLMVFLDILGFFMGDGRFTSGVGFWMGILYIVPGALIFSAARQNSKGLLCAGLVLDIIVSLMGPTGMAFASIEMASRSSVVERIYQRLSKSDQVDTNPFIYFHKYKALFFLLATIGMSIVLLIHSGFACHDWCSCCQSNEPVVVQQPQQQMVVYQTQSQPPAAAPIQQMAGYPPTAGGQQQSIYPMQYPQQMSYPSQVQQQQAYQSQLQQQQAYPSQVQQQPPYNFAYAQQDGGYPMASASAPPAPPPYQEVVASQEAGALPAKS